MRASPRLSQNWRFAMKRHGGGTLLVFAVAVGTYAVAGNHPQPRAIVQEGSAAIPRRDDGGTSLSSGASVDMQRAVSRESIEYLQKLRKSTPFGAADFNLD